MPSLQRVSGLSIISTAMLIWRCVCGKKDNSRNTVDDRSSRCSKATIDEPSRRGGDIGRQLIQEFKELGPEVNVLGFFDDRQDRVIVSTIGQEPQQRLVFMSVRGVDEINFEEGLE